MVLSPNPVQHIFFQFYLILLDFISFHLMWNVGCARLGSRTSYQSISGPSSSQWLSLRFCYASVSWCLLFTNVLKRSACGGPPPPHCPLCRCVMALSPKFEKASLTEASLGCYQQQIRTPDKRRHVVLEEKEGGGGWVVAIRAGRQRRTLACNVF